MASDQIAEQFRGLYEQWEQYLKSRFGEGDLYRLSKKFWQEEVDKCKKERISENQLLGLVNIRNAHTHSSELLEIKRYAVTLLRKLVNTFCRKAEDIATPRSKIYKANLQTRAQEVIIAMNDNLYTHIPIIEGKKFYGVFSENTLLKIIALSRWKDDLQIGEIKDLFIISRQTDDFRFLPADAHFYDVYQLFQEYIDRGKRLGVVFLTKTGKATGEINGLITAWDLHKGLKP